MRHLLQGGGFSMLLLLILAAGASADHGEVGQYHYSKPLHPGTVVCGDFDIYGPGGYSVFHSYDGNGTPTCVVLTQWETVYATFGASYTDEDPSPYITAANNRNAKVSYFP